MYDQPFWYGLKYCSLLRRSGSWNRGRRQRTRGPYRRRPRSPTKTLPETVGARSHQNLKSMVSAVHYTVSYFSSRESLKPKDRSKMDLILMSNDKCLVVIRVLFICFWLTIPCTFKVIWGGGPCVARGKDHVGTRQNYSNFKNWENITEIFGFEHLPRYLFFGDCNRLCASSVYFLSYLRLVNEDDFFHWNKKKRICSYYHANDNKEPNLVSAMYVDHRVTTIFWLQFSELRPKKIGVSLESALLFMRYLIKILEYRLRIWYLMVPS